MTEGISDAYASLTRREREILRLTALDLSNPEIAERLVVSPQTLKWYLREIYAKLGVHSREEAIAFIDRFESAAAPEPEVVVHNLPAPVTSLIGRRQEIATVRNLLRAPAIRLVTLLGTPGVGKTRLSVEVAYRLEPDFPDGIAFVPLAPISAPAHVGDAIVGVLNLDTGATRSVREVLKLYLKSKRLLLVLDNFEHLLPASLLVGELLAAAPGIKVLSTSREPLRLYGEREFVVPPLDPSSEAVLLFAERAKAVRPEFEVNEDNATAVTAICKRLDGLPLAIELAAARTKLHTPHVLLNRLTHRLNVLTDGARDLSERQQTLRAAIAWSYDLLSMDEQQMFAWFSVFDGGASAEAFAAVCGEGLSIDPGDKLEALVGKSLITQTTGTDGEPRYSMLETIKEFAAERLAAFGEEGRARLAHARYYLSLAERYADSYRTRDEGWGFRGFETDYLNIRSAWLVAAAQPDDALIGLIAGKWYRLYIMVGRAKDGAYLYQSALHSRMGDESITAAHLMNGFALLSWKQGDSAANFTWSRHALRVFEHHEHAEGRVRALLNLSYDPIFGADETYWEHLLQVALAIAEVHHLGEFIDTLPMGLAKAEFERGNYAQYIELMEAQLAGARQKGIRSLETWLCAYLVPALVAVGDFERAGVLAQAGLDAARALNMRRKIGEFSGMLAGITFIRGDPARARPLQLQALEHDTYAGLHDLVLGDNALLAAIEAQLRNLDSSRKHWNAVLDAFAEFTFDPSSISSAYAALCTAPIVAAAFGQPGLGVEIASAVTAYPKTVHWFIRVVNLVLPQLRARMGDAAFEAAWERGAKHTLADSIEASRHIMDQDTELRRFVFASRDEARIANQTLSDPLTPREFEVLQLVAAGLSNGDIAGHLVVDVSTVKKHVNHIYSKLAIATRSDVSTRAHELGLL